jgi:tripartite-type tricarboxylate transporter receptor subunit TctC
VQNLQGVRTTISVALSVPAPAGTTSVTDRLIPAEHAAFLPGSTQHIAVMQLQRTAGVKFTYVPFPGGVPAVNALLGGHVNAVLQNYSDVRAHLKAGTLRALATTSRVRMTALPELATVAELGFPDYEAEVWFGTAAPAKSPTERVTELGQWLLAAMDMPEVKTKLIGQGLYPSGTCGAEFGAHIRKHYDAYGRIIREIGMKGE